MITRKVSPQGIKLIHFFEQCVLKPYLCPAGVPTIGWGNTWYKNGKKVTMKDKPITQAEADDLFLFILGFFEHDVNTLLGDTSVKPNQFDSICSFAYNVGSDIDADDIPEGLGDSTLLKKIKANPNDPAIVNEFLKWNKANGKVCPGLVKRRTHEATWYTIGKLSFIK